MSATAAPGPAWLQRCSGRRRASALPQLGFPTRRDEEWRFTNVSPIAETPFRRAAREDSTLTPDASGAVHL